MHSHLRLIIRTGWSLHVTLSLILFAVLGLCASVHSENANGEIGGHKIRLSGVMRVNGTSWAFIVPEKESDDVFPRAFREGEGYGGFLVSKISCRPAEVTIEKDGEKVVLALKDAAGAEQANEKNEAAEIKLQKMPLRQMVDIFQTMSGRCMVRAAALRTGAFTMSAAGGRREVLGKVAEAMEKEGLALTNITQKITALIPEGAKVKFPKERLKLPKGGVDEIVPSGTMWLSLMPFDQFRQIYEMYSGVKVVSGPGVRAVDFTFRQEIDMTRGEMVHALELLYAVSGIQVENQGEVEVKLTPMPQ